jgi:hypothetical protein
MRLGKRVVEGDCFFRRRSRFRKRIPGSSFSPIVEQVVTVRQTRVGKRVIRIDLDRLLENNPALASGLVPSACPRRNGLSGITRKRQGKRCSDSESYVARPPLNRTRKFAAISFESCS